MAMTKIGKLKLETSAYYQQKQSTNIRFYNMDINTSILRFIVTRNNNVLPLGKNNTDIMVYLKAQDGSWLIDEVSVSDELNGICEYQIPNEFLNHTGKVEGQVYISVDKKEDTVTEVDFTFTVEDALINQIPAVDKIAYIRKYTELENRLKEKVQNIEDAYKNIDDYITKVQQASETGVMQINDSKTIAITEIQNEKDNSITLINETSDTQIGFVSEKIETVNRMISDFKAQVDSELFVKHTDSEKWQKYATTESDGNRIILEQLTEDVINLPVGSYTTTIPADETIARTPIINEILDSAYRAFIDVNQDSLNQKQIIITNIETGNIYVKHIQYDGAELGWKKIPQLYELDEPVNEDYVNDKLLQYDNDIKSHLSNNYKQKNKKIFSGDARERNTTFQLTNAFNEFSYLLVKYRYPGGGKTIISYIDTGNILSIQDTNLTDSTGDNPYIYEMGVKFNNNKEFVVTHNNVFNIKNSTPIYDANYIGIREIEGVY